MFIAPLFISIKNLETSREFSSMVGHVLRVLEVKSLTPSRMVQWVNTLVTKDDFSSIPGTNMVEGNYQLLQIVL